VSTHLRLRPVFQRAARIARTLVTLCLAPMVMTSRADDGTWSLEASGELRERFESINNPVFGLATPVQDDYFLHRAMLTAKVRYGENWTAATKWVSGQVSSSDALSPATQENSFDVLEAYIEKSSATLNGRVQLRLGRQEMAFGAARLVSVRESPNIRRAFDGVNAIWTNDSGVSASAFFVRPVSPKRGALDDLSSDEHRFWGLYVTWQSLGLDAYYLGIDRDDAVFAQGIANETRHTIGARSFGERDGWDWNVEAAGQWGSFGDASIRAWTLSVETGFSFSWLPLSPRIGIKADIISGDDDEGDGRLGTFNPLFPKLPYFSEANLATPANLRDVQPSLGLTLTTKLSMSMSWNRLWKDEKRDAFYQPFLVPVSGTALTQSRNVGSQASVVISWQATHQLEVAATYVAFEPHSVVKQAGGYGGDFFAVWIRWTS
jgi:hypothetical protein